MLARRQTNFSCSAVKDTAAEFGGAARIRDEYIESQNHVYEEGNA